MVPKSFESDSDLVVDMKPRARLGAAYVNNYLTVGLDIDIIKNKPLATEGENQEVALGVEFRPWRNLDIRFGYRHDSASERDDVLSTGVRYQIWRVIGELSFAQSDDITSGALQVGWAF